MTRRTLATLAAVTALVASSSGVAQAVDGEINNMGPCPVVKCKHIN